MQEENSESTSPTDPEDDDTIDSSSAASSPAKSGPFTPLYSISVTDAVKNGDALQFTIQVVQQGNEDKVKVSLRKYDDVEWLYHCLITQNDISGLIVPPLPPRPEVDAKAAESKSKKQLGSDTKVIIPDEFDKDCRNLEKYLRMVVTHEVLGTDKTLQEFLCNTEAPLGTKVKRGIMSRLSSRVEEARKGQHKDIDEYFHKQREWATDYSKSMKEMNDCFNKLVYAEMRVSTAYGHLASALAATDVYRDDCTVKINKLLGSLGEAADNAKHGLEVLSSNDDKTLGFQLSLYTRYMESVKEMLFRRTCLLVEYEDANKTLDKAKPNKQQAAEEAKKKAENAYENCTENARRELKSFLQQRLLAFEEGFSKFAKSQIKTARDTYTLLVRTLTSVKQMDL